MKNKIRVLYVSANGYLGGAEKVVLDLVKFHEHSNLVKPVLLFFNAGEACELAKQAGTEVYILKNTFRLSRPWQLIRALSEIKQLTQKLKIEVIHSTMAYAHLVMSLSLSGQKIKRVWFQHGPVDQWLDKVASLFRLDLLFFNSLYLKMLHNKHVLINVPEEKQVVVPLGVVRANKVWRKRNDFKLLTIGAAGRITPFKGLHVLIRSLADQKQKGIEFKCLIAGEPKTKNDQVYAEELKQLCDQLGLKDQITFLGHVKDMSTFYDGVDLFIHAPLSPEPFGLVMAEAMAQGCLVLGLDQGGSVSFLKDGVTGLTVKPDASSLGRADNLTIRLSEILTNKSKLQQYKVIAERGQQKIHDHFTFERMGEEVEKAYLSLLTEK